ncbi:MAG TPA: thymidylate synthase (FAD), partial [Planctomycetaceae bacterium]|nr:thymidylate synthase (FAD) [Planctomycetaceae bacterium]
HNLLHFLRLRMEPNAQQEIRQYAHTIGHEIVKPLFPIVWEAFEDYRLNSLTLSRLDQEVIQRLMGWAAESGKGPPFSVDDFLRVQDETWRPLSRCRERDECLAKLQAVGIVRSEH